MADTYEKSLHELALKVGDFPEEAFHFIRDGLSYAVNRVHGPESPAQMAVLRYLAKNKLELNDLSERYERGELSKEVMTAITEAGGLEKLNRHVSGSEMCWGLREYAHHRWGMLSTLVLGAWNVRTTFDFGRLVFAMIDFDFMQKQPSDTLNDFRDVFTFPEALKDQYEISFERE